MFKQIKKLLYSYLRSVDAIWELQEETAIFLENEKWISGIQDRRYDDPRRLTRFGYKAFSQSDEDGIIAEIFRRVGFETRVFFEFGVEDGRSNNTLNLLLGGWRGYWIDGSAENVAKINVRFRDYIDAGQLKAISAFITRENINSLIEKLAVPSDIDLLSIDIDGNDYWVWQAIESLSPRVVVIEYNGTFRSTHSVVMKYDSSFVWDKTNYFGASLSALEKLGRTKGYSLVGCNYTGVNAFFVRNDLVGERFLPPFTAETHYEEARYLRLKAGHPGGTGPYVQV